MSVPVQFIHKKSRGGNHEGKANIFYYVKNANSCTPKVVITLKAKERSGGVFVLNVPN